MPDLRGELRVGAHVLVQLGSELVTDVEQALLECVKNAYDADSPGCRIAIDTKATGTLEEVARADALWQFREPAENVAVHFETIAGEKLSKSPDPDTMVRRKLNYRGCITIEDSGTGISFDNLSKSWLVISASLKRGSDEGPKKKTPLGRTPLGDKGLGRLGTMKLGDILLVESATSPDAEISSAWFRWSDCERAYTVDQIPVKLSQSPNTSGFKGTRVSVLGVRDIEDWTRKGRIDEIARSMARLISPFESTTTFPVIVELDEREQSLALVTEDLLARAIADFTFDWQRIDGKPVLIAKARLRRRLLTSQRTKALRERTARVFEQDDGKAFADYLRKSKRLKGYQKTLIDTEGSWFAEIEHRFRGQDLLSISNHAAVNPGAFSGAFYFFHFVGDDEEQSGVASGTGANLKTVRELAGISILRDGFQVRNRGDWLGLSVGMTSGSTYNLRPENTLGYFALSGEKNFRLTEKSDREGFVDNAAYRGFLNIAKSCRDFANDAIVNVRRTLDEYDKTLRDKIDSGSKSTEGDLAQVGSLADAAVEIAKLTETLEREVRALDGPQSEAGEKRERVLAITQKVLQLANPDTVLSESPSVVIGRMELELKDARERSVALIESAAAGLASRGLTHELRAHLAEIRHRVSALERAGGLGHEAVSHLTSIRRSCNAIAQAATQIDPLIPRARELKEKFDVLQTIRAYFEQRRSIYSAIDIDVEIDGEPLIVRMNKSRLLQTLDNLTRNSIFWLGQLPKSRKRAIGIEVNSSGFVLSDTGPGVDRLVEETLFDLFVTTRLHEEGGQGLGLFISSELLALDGCSIALLPERNKSGRKYRFMIDLTPVRQGSSNGS